MTPIGVLPAAQEDLRRAARFYEARSQGLGTEFLAEVTRAFARLSENPDLGVLVRSGSRKLLLRRFPFLVIYRIERKRVLVLAVDVSLECHPLNHEPRWKFAVEGLVAPSVAIGASGVTGLDFGWQPDRPAGD